MIVKRRFDWQFIQVRQVIMLATAFLVEQPVVAQAVGQTTASGVEDPVASEPQSLPNRAPIDGHLATSAVGELGQRQTADTTVSGIKPGARIQNRIQNRVQTRVQNRIDRNYSPLPQTGDVFAAAALESQVRNSR